MTRLAGNPLEDQPPTNRGFLDEFCHWLRDGGYSESTVSSYSIAVRLALDWLEKDYQLVDPEADLDRARAAIAARYEREATRRTYFKGLAKLAEYLHFHGGRPAPEREVNWHHYLGPLPDWLAGQVRDYVILQQRNWRPEDRYRATCTTLSHLTVSLRWMAARVPLPNLEAITPTLWLDYVDARLAAGIHPATLNRELGDLRRLLHFLAEQGEAVCGRMLLVEPLRVGSPMPRDIPVEQLRRLLQQLKAKATSEKDGARRAGLLDRAWCLLMVTSGLRTGEVRRLRLSDLNLDARRVRIEQSKGLQDRMVCISQETAEALRAYLAARGPVAGDRVFIHNHRPLTLTYCRDRLCTAGERCGVRVTPHQLRHSFASLLLNAGAPILVVQALMGHKHVDTTLRYARLYDSTVAADYERAITSIEGSSAMYSL
jgi:site-specific recombinase XerD